MKTQKENALCSICRQPTHWGSLFVPWDFASCAGSSKGSGGSEDSGSGGSESSESSAGSGSGGGSGCGGSGEDSPRSSAVELRTSVPDAARPSRFEMYAAVAAQRDGECGAGQRCAASCRSGDLASEHFA
jgi:hypothetical protein